ncbi:MAG: methylmalonyl-CoA mutase family protein [Rikenellaceae bacterium]|nr:methylmalonyl-CoA mutase family protein [Rikenellaceae bacterium]
MANKEQKLLTEFPPVSTEKWEEVITADLKGADYQKKLVWKTAEGFDVRPYYRAEDLEAVRHLGAGIGEFPYVRSTGKCNKWRVQQTVTVKDPVSANAEALKAIAGGAEAVGFVLRCDEVCEEGFGKLLKGIDPAAVELTFSGAGAASAAERFIARLESEGADPEKVRANFVIDPLITRLSLKGAFGCCEDGSVCFARIAELVKRGAEYPRLRFTGVSGHQFHNSGSTIVQELAFTLAAGHEYVVKLMEAGLTADQAAGSIRFSMAVSSNYFMEIAKFRAARMLWANIIKAYDPKCGRSEKMFVHAVTSKWNLTVYDPYVNMLRGTTEAMSASIAGVHSLEVLPFDAAYACPTEFSSRIARNVQLLLKNESHFDSVVDPSGGSYYIETLTRSIAEQAWALFREVEDKGGYIEAFKTGFIQDKIEESANRKDHNIATRRQILLGTNQYPNFNETAGEEITEKTVSRKACNCGCDSCGCESDKGDCGCGGNSDGDCNCGCDDCTCGGEGEVKTLKPYRGGMAFEELRLRVDRSGREPKAFMLTCGSLAMARARSQFSSNFFGCAGIRVIDNNFFADVEEGARKALSSGAEIIVLCAADDDYAALAPRVKELLGGKAILVVAGAPASMEELKAQGIGNFINVRSNVLETLKQYVADLGI